MREIFCGSRLQSSKQKREIGKFADLKRVAGCQKLLAFLFMDW